MNVAVPGSVDVRRVGVVRSASELVTTKFTLTFSLVLLAPIGSSTGGAVWAMVAAAVNVASRSVVSISLIVISSTPCPYFNSSIFRVWQSGPTCNLYR